jgi:glycosyltransferase involved in cell wall biosynthesis
MRNAQQWVADAIWSIKRQTFRDWECIIVNDHSSDQSTDLVREVVAHDPRFHLLENAGRGIIDALQTALHYSTAPWITRMDADDLMPPEKLFDLVQALRGDEEAVATGRVRYFAPHAVSDGYRSYEQWLNQRLAHDDHWKWIYRECVIASANWLTHRKNVVFGNVYPEDYDLVFHWYHARLKIRSTASITHWWREHEARTSRVSDAYNQASFFSLKLKRFLALDRVREKPLVILGQNIKSDLSINILAQQDEVPILLDKENYRRLENMPDAQVLVAVFPSDGDRKKLEHALLRDVGTMGKDWWWL